jgi:hypothetical protein
MEKPIFSYAAGVPSGQRLSEYSATVISDVMAAAKVEWCLVTSLERSPRDQARVMFRNCEQHGVAEQKRLYGVNGDAVIAVYESGKTLGLDAPTIIDRMEKEIFRLGPSNVSHHCADSKLLQVIDIGPHSIQPISQIGPFIAAAKADHRISRVLTPEDGDPAVHIEIPQPQPKLA